jgi:hypothetical protein
VIVLRVSIQINNTPLAKDDVVQVKCDHPVRRFTVPCRIRLIGPATAPLTIVLTNPDGRLRLKYTRGGKFKKLIKEKGVHAPGQHANKEFRAALYWFCDLGAITEDEFNDIERIYALRNDIGHKLFQVISDEGINVWF